MRLQRSERLQGQWYTLPPEIRRFIESLKTDPRPSGARVVNERLNRYEEFVADLWVIWQLDDSTGDTIIKVTIAE